MISDDTIVAISSAVGPAARMIVRLSGPAAWNIVSKFAPVSISATPGSVLRTSLLIDDLAFPATLYLFRSPRSATGEDVVEIHLPGPENSHRGLISTDGSIWRRPRALQR